ncbi:MAG: hypothetical protein HY537_00650 [Deltaproteobacteria bacterium]|nr:hypothetical protein [Deltaproteobacteria bacterium]
MFLWLPLAAPVLCFLLHWCVSRSPLYPWRARQGAIAFIALCVSVVYGLVGVIAYGDCPGPTLFVHSFYLWITSLGLAYCYFHVFNMSQTARRIRILVSWYEAEKEGNQRQFGIPEINPQAIVTDRLQLLETMGSLEQRNGRYFARWGIMLAAAHVFGFLRILFPSFMSSKKS